MLKHRLRWTAALMLLSACAPQTADVGHRAPPVAARPASSFPALQALADEAVRDGKLPAITIAIGVGDEPPTFISAGRVELDPAARPASADTLYRIYSMTKPVTGVAAMILVDEGKLRLDQPVSDFFPSFKSSRVLVDPAKSLETRPAARPITIRDLMTHTSGLNYGLGEKSPAITAMLDAGITPYQLTRSMEQDFRSRRPKTLAEFGERIGAIPLTADPGTKFIYSQGLDVLAAVVERASGMPYESFLRTRLLEPLGMNSTYWQVPRDQAGRLVSNYGSGLLLAAFGGKPETSAFMPLDSGATSVYLDPPSFPYGGAGLVSTAKDYDRFLHMLLDDGQLDGVRILSPQTARLAQSNLFPAGVTLKSFGPIAVGDATGFGAGGYVTLSKVDSHGRGQGTYGWDGAAGTRAWVDPVRRIRATMMINTFMPHNMGPRFDKAVAADLGSAPAR